MMRIKIKYISNFSEKGQIKHHPFQHIKKSRICTRDLKFNHSFPVQLSYRSGVG